jgi:hypothetical protein
MEAVCATRPLCGTHQLPAYRESIDLFQENAGRSVHAAHATVEHTMPVICFEKPVFILVGLGFPRKVESVWDAFVVLNEWPTPGPQQEAMLNACRASMNGKFDAERIRDAFAAFAREVGILMPEALERPAHTSISSLSGGPRQASNGVDG